MNPSKCPFKNLINLVLLMNLFAFGNFHKLIASSFTEDGFQPLPDVVFERGIAWLDLWHKTQREIILTEGSIEMMVLFDCIFDERESKYIYDLTSYVILEDRKPPDIYTLMRLRDTGANGEIDSAVKIVLEKELRDEFLNETWSWVESAELRGQAFNIGTGLNLEVFVTAGKPLPNGGVTPRQLIHAVNPPTNGRLYNLLKRFDSLLKENEE